MRISDWSSDVCSSDLADMLEHADRDDAVELPGEGAIIDKLELHPVGNVRLGGAALGHGGLLLRQGDAQHVHIGDAVEVERKPAPAAADVEPPLSPLQDRKNTRLNSSH